MSQQKHDQNFVIAENGVLVAPAHKACRSAAVYPLAANGRTINTKELQKVYDRLYRRWRLRLVHLKKAGWDYLNKGNEGRRFVFSRNCPPAGIRTATNKKMYSCGNGRVCPHCYARQVVMESCLGFEIAIPQHKALSDQGHLSAFRRTMVRSREKWPIDRLMKALKTRNAHNIETDFCPVWNCGSAVSVSVSMDADGINWIIERSGVILYGCDRDQLINMADAVNKAKNNDHMITKTAELSVDNACKLVGWAMKYPTNMFQSPLPETVELLHRLADESFKQIRFRGLLRNSQARKAKLKQSSAS